MLRKRSVETLAQAGKRLQCVCYREASTVHSKNTSLAPKPGRSSEHLVCIHGFNTGKAGYYHFEGIIPLN